MQYEYPTVYKNTTRAIPITTHSQNLFMLKQAKMRVQNEALDKKSVLSNRETRYNARLFDDIDQEKVNKNVYVKGNNDKYVQPKFAVKSLQPDNNIAIYNTRQSHDLNEQYLIGNVLPERLKAIRDTKVTTPNAWMKDYSYIKNSYENTGLPEVYTQGEELKTFPINKEGFEQAFNNYQDEIINNNDNIEHFKGNDDNKISDFGYGLNMQPNNYNGYLSMLMPSTSNIPDPSVYNDYTTDQPQPNAAMFPDHRLQQNLQTQQRQLMGENYKVINMANLHNSPYIKERNERQREMETLMNHHGKLKLPMIKTQDYINFLDEQNNGMNGLNYELDQASKNLKDRYNDRNSGGIKFATKPETHYNCTDDKLATVSDALTSNKMLYKPKDKNKHPPRVGNINKQNNILSDIDYTDFKQNDAHKTLYNYNLVNDPKLSEHVKRRDINNINVNDNIVERYEQEIKSQQGIYKDDTKKRKDINLQHKEKYRDLNKIYNNIDNNVDNEERFKQAVNVEQFNKQTININDKQKFNNKQMNISKYQHRNQIADSNYPIVNVLRGEGYITREFFSLNDHILIQRKGEISTVYSSPNSDNVAPVLISLDTTNKPIRTMATKNNKTIYIIQKRDPTYTDIETGNYYEDDYVALEVPLEKLPNKLRQHIETQYKKQNRGFNAANNRHPSKILNLEFEDLVSLAEIIYKQPEDTKRIKMDSMKRYLENNEFDRNILYGFEDKVFTTPFVVEQMIMNDRIKEDRLHTEERSRRIDKDQYNIDNGNDITPKNDKQYSDNSREGYLGTLSGNPYNPDSNYNMRNKQMNSHYYSFEMD